MEIESESTKKKDIETVIAKTISILFHPLLMPTYGFLSLFFTKNYIATFTPLNLKLLILLITFVFTFFLPALNALILLKMGRIRSLEMESSEERYVPYISTALYYFALFYLFYTVDDFPAVFKLLILGAAISILLTLIVNIKWKISAHSIGIGGVVAAIIGISFRLMIDLRFIVVLAILISGIIGYARLKLKAHTPAQVYSGFLLGFLVEFALMLFL